MTSNTETNDKLFYKMGEVSTMLNVAPSLLRFWEKEFDCLKTLTKNRKGDRMYTKHNIEDLKMIQHLVKERGYTLNGANDFINQNIQTNNKHQEILKSLNKMKDFFEELKQNV
ncbi:MAG: MerR family transcriptional regulator [Bacteroidota bacterium]|nr:MerR family transcriptional regulator [Bacteroidota bacterium]